MTPPEPSGVKIRAVLGIVAGTEAGERREVDERAGMGDCEDAIERTAERGDNCQTISTMAQRKIRKDTYKVK